jgi:hypothetical protein
MKKNYFIKRWGLLSVVVLIVSGSTNSCKKTAPQASRLGKFVVYGGCTHFVVQLMDATAADSAVVTNSWTDTSTNITYTNVFGVSNVCTFGGTAADPLQVGDEFYFTLNGPVPQEVCYTCYVWPYAMPAATNSVTNIRRVTTQ